MGVSLRQAVAALRALGIKVSHEGLRKRKLAGTIPVEPDGTVDPAKVAAVWNQHSHPGRGSGEQGATAGQGYAVARAAREMYDARIREFEYRRLAGELIEATAVKAAAFEESRRARNMLQAIPSRIASVVAGLSDASECHKVIEDEINRVCDELAGRMPEAS